MWFNTKINKVITEACKSTPRSTILLLFSLASINSLILIFIAVASSQDNNLCWYKTSWVHTSVKYYFQIFNEHRKYIISENKTKTKLGSSLISFRKFLFCKKKKSIKNIWLQKEYTEINKCGSNTIRLCQEMRCMRVVSLAQVINIFLFLFISFLYLKIIQ